MFSAIKACRAFFADHFDKKTFLFSSENNYARVKILKNEKNRIGYLCFQYFDPTTVICQ